MNDAATAMQLTRAELDILEERRRQITQEGWTEEHDDQHVGGELANAAACYAREAVHDNHYRNSGAPVGWPLDWGPEWWKPTTARRDLIKAASMIIAEIERLDRAAAKAAQP